MTKKRCRCPNLTAALFLPKSGFRLFGRHLRVVDKSARSTSQREILDAGSKFDCAMYCRSGSTARAAHNRTHSCHRRTYISRANATQGAQTRLPSPSNVPNPETPNCPASPLTGPPICWEVFVSKKWPQLRGAETVFFLVPCSAPLICRLSRGLRTHGFLSCRWLVLHLLLRILR
jgi:hypothetical protein